MSISQLDLPSVNAKLKNADAATIIDWALGLNEKTVMTTSFGFFSAVSLHLLTSHPKGRDVPVVWVDSGYNLADAYQVADELTQSLQLNLHVFNPLMSSERRLALHGGVPAYEEPEFQAFVEQVKLEPFNRALQNLQPRVWLTGIRQEETEHRKNLDIVSMDERGILKVAPLFYWQEADLEAYLKKYGLPNCKHYFDPTKVRDNAECGLHTFALKAQ